MNLASADPNLPPQTKHLMIVAGEASGDSHAAALVAEIKRLNPHFTFSGLGGPKMQKAGVHIDEDLTRFAVVGFIEVLKHYRDLKRCFKLFIEKAAERQPAAVILIDYPGFNLRLAGHLKKMGIKTIYYISPQVWAWKAKRVNFIKKNIDRMLVLFNFEKDFYSRYGVNVDFVGHPLADEIHITKTPQETLAAIELSTDKFTIGILPGSREKEIESLLPSMIAAAKIISKENPNAQFLILKAPNLDQKLFKNFLTNVSFPIRILDGHFHNGLNACDICMVASGTATLETALFLKPMVVVYKTSLLTYYLAKALITIPYIGLVNIVAGKKVVAECIQTNATGEKIAAELKKIYQDPLEFNRIKAELEKVRTALGAGGASQRAAKNILEFLNA